MPVIHHRSWGADGRDRHTAAHPLSHDNDVWHDPGMFKAEKFARAAEAALHLVQGQQNAVLVGQGAQFL